MSEPHQVGVYYSQKEYRRIPKGLLFFHFSIFSSDLTGPALQYFFVFELSRSVLIILKNAPNQLKILKDLIKMVGIILGKGMVDF